MKVLAMALTLLMGLSGSAWSGTSAEEEAERVGEFHVTLKNAAYTKVSVNGEDWGETEFERNGKVAHVKGLKLDETDQFEIVFTPVEDGLDPVTITVKPTEFKKRTIRRVRYHIAKKTISFPKKSVDKPAEPEKPKPAPTGPADDDFDL